MKGIFLAYADLWGVGNIPIFTTQYSTMRNYFLYVLSEWTSLEAFQTYATDPETAEAMRAAGVTGKPTVLMLDRQW